MFLIKLSKYDKKNFIDERRSQVLKVFFGSLTSSPECFFLWLGASAGELQKLRKFPSSVCIYVMLQVQLLSTLPDAG